MLGFRPYHLFLNMSAMLVNSFKRLRISGSRSLCTTSATRAPPYPFSSSAVVVAESPLPSPPALAPLGDSLMRHLNTHLASFHPNQTQYATWFSRRHKDRVLPGSVLTVTSYTSLPTSANPSPSTNTFSGVLMAIRRRHAGQDTSIRLRNLVGRTGVELSYKIWSPMVKSVKIVSRATNSGPAVVGKDGVEKDRKKPAIKAARRAKMYFVRDQPNR